MLTELHANNKQLQFTWTANSAADERSIRSLGAVADELRDVDAGSAVELLMTVETQSDPRVCFF